MLRAIGSKCLLFCGFLSFVIARLWFFVFMLMFLVQLFLEDLGSTVLALLLEFVDCDQFCDFL